MRVYTLESVRSKDVSLDTCKQVDFQIMIIDWLQSELRVLNVLRGNM